MQQAEVSIGSLPGIFEQTLFSPRRGLVSRSAYIKSMHPKTEIGATRAAVEKILAAGWAGQVKIHGHRAQVHLSADRDEEPIVFNRQGNPHKKLLPDEISIELYRILNLKKNWTVIDAEWLKPEGKLYIFDVLKKDGENLRRLTYAERFALLPKSFISPYIKALPLLTTVEKCMEVLTNRHDQDEGLVFKSLTSRGFEDTSIVRCRKRPASRT